LQLNRALLNRFFSILARSTFAGIARLGLILGSVCLCAIASQNAYAQVQLATSEPDPSRESSSLAALDGPAEIDGPPVTPNFAVPKLLSDLTSAPGALSYSRESASAPNGGQIKIVDQGPESVRRVQQELIFEGLYSYGNYTIFASGYDDKLFTAGVEYDRHSWGHFLKSQMDYVAEVLPFVLLDKPVCVTRYGNPCSPRSQSKLVREHVPGIGISPIGFRWQWRSNTAIRPYLEAKGGMLGFTKKVPASAAAYENFSLQSAMGVQIKMSERWGLRLGLFSDFHFSNAFIVGNNPGLDVMNANLGISYHF
jgi:Lipid A 3-O-deacylase (PagL)